MKELQEQDPKVSHLRKLWSENKLNKTLFTMENDILKRVLMINGLLYKPVVTPSILKDCLIMLAHDEQGHNGFKRTYASLQTVYYWKGMKRQIQLHCRRCRTCARHNVISQEFNKEHFAVPTQPMEFISNGSDRRISSCIKQRKSICPHCKLHANRIHFLYTTEK